ncbi:O-methyltransferase family protein [Hypoxylon sp. FL1284]|nr:O-methyltransferase family protein [Hypoxylon sp. FL1284]
MKEGTTILYATEQLGERVTKYAESVSLTIPQPIKDYHARIIEENPGDSNYMISNFQAQALVWLSRLIGAKRILEIGVYVGYSGMVWSHAIGPEGKVTGLEYDESYASAARKAWKEHGYNNIEVFVGDAKETLSQLANPSEPYDLVFIDADKTGYPAYLEAVLALSAPGSAEGRRLLRKGAIIAGDNALRKGLVADPTADNPHRPADFDDAASWHRTAVAGVGQFNAAAAANERLETFMCPLWDGLNLARLVD